MISTNDMRPGQAILFDGRICMIVEYNRVKPGKGPTFVKAKLKDMVTGQMLDKTWRGEQKVELAILQTKPYQYLYAQGGLYYFMDIENYDQIVVEESVVAEVKKFLMENMEVSLTLFENKPFKIDLPPFVEMKVVQTDPGMRGDTVTGVNKPATLESGAVVQVPLFVEIGDKLRIDTRTGTYVTRV